jgi:hypothetical protein
MSGFQTPMAGGISKLSELIIDADKVWADKGISSVKELAAGMVKGDFLVHDGTRIIRLPPGIANTVLTSGGALTIPSWQPGGTYYSRYFPASIYITNAAARKTVSRLAATSPALQSSNVMTTSDLPASMVKQLLPAMTTTINNPKVTINQNATKSAAITCAHTESVA